MSIVYLKYIFHKHLLDLLEAQAHFGGQTLYGRPERQASQSSQKAEF